MSDAASSPFRALFATEVRMLVRDKRTLVASVLLPTLLMPLFFFASSFGERQRQERIAEQSFRYLLFGPKAAEARRLLALDPGPDAERAGVTLEEVSAPERGSPAAPPVEVLDDGRADVVVQASPGAPVGDGETARPGPIQLTLFFLADADASNTAVEALQRRLGKSLVARQDGLLQDAGFTLERRRMGTISERLDVATAGEKTGAAVGRWASLFLMLFLIVGGSVVAADTLAGEKERGTLETLLGTSASRREIISAKLAGIFCLGLVITLIQLANLGLYAGLRIIDLPQDFTVDFGAVAVASLLALFVPLAFVTSAALLWASGRSSTYKGFQIALLPLMLGLMAPTAAAFVPGIELRSVVAAVPIAGVAVAVRDVLVG
ncbi:MAG: ABC transporter permease subunit, partial [Acidobacteriota bacterium]